MLTLPALRSSAHIELSGGFDLRETARLQFAEEFKTPRFESFEELITSENIDAVYIATPHELHADQAISAMQAGKHVLVEKPMAVSLRNCQEMADAAESCNRVLVVGPSHGFDEPVIRVRELVASGKFGALRMITTFNFTDFMYRPRRPEELDSSRGGGVVYSQAAHQIDMVRRIAQMPVTRIFASAGNWDQARKSEGAYSAIMQFADQSSATLSYSGYAHYDSDELLDWVSELGTLKDPSRYGETRKQARTSTAEQEAAAKLDRTYGPHADLKNQAPAPFHEHFGFLLVSCDRADLKVSPKGIMIYADDTKEFIELAPPTVPRAAVLDEFVNAVLGIRRPIHDGRWGVETMACCEALLQSNRLGREVDPMTLLTS